MRSFVNWSREHRVTPKSWESPGSEAEVIDVVQRTRAEGRRLRVVGGGHSWSDIAVCDDTLVTLDGLAGLVEVDAERHRVTVRGGTRLHAWLAAAAAHGLDPSIVGSVLEQSVAGATATGTHGSSLKHGNLASAVVGMRLVTGTGEVLELGEGDPRLDAARVHLGALGVVTELTLQMEPAFRLLEVTEPLPFDAALAELDGRMRGAEYFKLWWTPHTAPALAVRADRTEDAANLSRVGRWLDAKVVNPVLLGAIVGLGNKAPGAIPTLNKLVAASYFKARRRVGSPADILSLSMPPRHRETEYVLPVDRAAEALDALRGLIERLRIRVNFIVELRVVKGDAGWMSPDHGGDTCHLGAYIGRTPEAERYFEAFYDLMDEMGARPHWGKSLRLDPQQTRALWPRAADFAALAAELDPDGVFRNRFIDRVL